MTLSINVDVRARSWNRDVIRKLAKADKRFLHWYGGALRKSIRRSFREGKKTSKPDKPPRRWAGNGGLRLVSYEVNRSNTEVTVGVLKFNSKQAGTKAVPGLLEEGGTAKRRFLFVNTGPLVRMEDLYAYRRPKGIAKKHLRIIFSKTAKPRSVRYRKRPFVKPAFDRINKDVAERYARVVARAMS